MVSWFFGNPGSRTAARGQVSVTGEHKSVEEVRFWQNVSILDSVLECNQHGFVIIAKAIALDLADVKHETLLHHLFVVVAAWKPAGKRAHDPSTAVSVLRQNSTRKPEQTLTSFEFFNEVHSRCYSIWL